MSLTFGQAKEILSQYQGKGGKVPTAAKLDVFTRKVLDYLLISGSPNCERKFTLYAVNGCVTAPFELEVPLKVQVNGRVGSVVPKWFEFRSGSDLPGICQDASDILSEEPNTYYTVYDGPAGGFRVGVMGVVEEDADAHIIIAGQDTTGREIFTNHKGEQIAGEYLSIIKNQLVWSNVTFGNITGVVKTKTRGYTPLYWKSPSGLQGFLADYSPVDEVPSYRRFRLNINCPSPSKVTILGRVRLKDHYADSDVIPFQNLYAIEIAGQQVNKQYNEKVDEALKTDNFLQSLTNREANYKKPNTGTPLDVFFATSGGTIKGIIP